MHLHACVKCTHACVKCMHDTYMVEALPQHCSEKNWSAKRREATRKLETMHACLIWHQPRCDSSSPPKPLTSPSCPTRATLLRQRLLWILSLSSSLLATRMLNTNSDFALLGISASSTSSLGTFSFICDGVSLLHTSSVIALLSWRRSEARKDLTSTGGSF